MSRSSFLYSILSCACPLLIVWQVLLCIIAKACLSDERPPDQCFGPVDGKAA